MPPSPGFSLSPKEHVPRRSYHRWAVELDFAIMADGVGPRPDGKLDIYGAGWDTIYAATAPVQHSQFALVARVLLSSVELESSHQLVVLLHGADGQEIARAVGDVESVPDDQRETIPADRKVGIGLILTFQSLVFPEHGAYHLALLWDGNELREPLRLFVEPLPAG